MAGFSWSQVLVFLVAGLACFLEICDAANTTTAAPTTATPTIAAPNVTTAASNMTTAASNMTTASSMTTAASNMTTAPSNMTTAPSNMTTTVSNMTTAASNMTTAPSNMTTAPSNMTTTPSNMTTTTSNMTTTQMVTTSAPETRWKVKGKDGKLCMLMDFDGTITYKGSSHQIPPSASITKSTCASATFSMFVVEYYEPKENLWQLVLNFTTTKNSFQLNSKEMTVSLYKNSTLENSGKNHQDFLDVPFGDYYQCDYLNASLDMFSVNMTKPTFQPFVNKTKGDDKLGQEYQCTNGSSGNHINIAIGIIITIVVLIAAIGVTYYVVKRRGQPSDPPYARVQ